MLLILKTAMNNCVILALVNLLIVNTVLTLIHEHQRPNIFESAAVTKQGEYDIDLSHDQQRVNGFQNWPTDSRNGAERSKSTGENRVKWLYGDLEKFSLSKNIDKVNKVMLSSRHILWKNGQKFHKNLKRVRRETENQNTTNYSGECEILLLSCRNCCNNSNNCTRQPKLCHCDPQCAFYNDCCVDYETFCGKKHEISFGIDQKGLSCIQPQYVDLDSEATGMWMVNKCPSNRKSDEISQSCENTDQLALNITSIRKLVPVIAQNNLTFRNEFCAKCNGIEDFEYYAFNMPCHVVPFAFNGSFAELAEFTSKYCSPNNWLHIFREADQPFRECNEYFRNFCPTLKELRKTCNQPLECAHCVLRHHWCDLNMSKWDDDVEEKCRQLCKPKFSPVSEITPFTTVFRLTKQGDFVEIKCLYRWQFYDRYLGKCRTGESISSPNKHNLDRYDVVVWLDIKEMQLIPTLSETVSSLAELFNFKHSQVSASKNIHTFDANFMVVRFKLDLTAEQMLRLGKANTTTTTTTNDSEISTNVLPLRRLLFFLRKFNVTVSRDNVTVTLTVFKTTSRQLACIGKQTYPTGTYSSLEHGNYYYINSTGKTFAKNQVFFEKDKNDSISVCAQIVSKDCDGLRINLTSQEYIRFDNLSIFFNRTKKIYDFGEYDIENGHVFMCIPDNSKIIHWIPSDSDVVEKYLTLICFLVSLVCLFLVIQTYVIFAELRNIPGKNILNLSIALFLVQLLWLIPDRWYLSTLCYIAALIKHYLFLVSFVAMATIAWDTHSVFASDCPANRSSSKFYKYLAIAWAVPAMFVVACAVVDRKEIYAVYVNELLCWFDNTKAQAYLFVLPVGIILLFNIILFALTVFCMQRVRVSARLILADQRNKTMFWVYLKLSALMGFSWLFGFIYLLVGTLVFSYLFVIFASLQGAYIALAFVMKKSVWQKYKKLLGRNQKEYKASYQTNLIENLSRSKETEV